MTTTDAESAALLRVEYKNNKPVELLDLTTSLAALGESYQEFAWARGFDPQPGNVRLYIKELRTGSIIAELQSYLDQASFVLKHVDVYAAFLANFDDLTRFFLSLNRTAEERDSRPSRMEANHINQILEPIAKDNGAQIFMTIQGDAHIDVANHYDSNTANIIQNQIRRLYRPELPISLDLRSEPLTLFQMRDDPRGKAGDRGIIERLSSKPVKLQFMNEEAKRRVLEVEYPFRKIFLIDGEVGTADGRPAVYKIYYVRDVIDRDDVG
jgi:hypothetical protein